MHNQKIVTIDGREYSLEKLSDQAKSQLMNVRVADQRITKMQQDLAIHQTARNAYARALAETLSKVDQ
ncbi:DUF6447 family protein [Spongiibacter marinus]|uniref:DUF6447 family protein n=1 Tax=Spongiibacter marinus TaxID=354246 RepID=UPI00195F6634|nr:DUF6447 family protein [Spongiibacter marinus]